MSDFYINLYMYMTMSSWKIRKFCYLHLGAFFLLFSLFGCHMTANIWHTIDVHVFRALNEYIRERPIQQVFWACCNIRLTDIFGAIYLGLIFILFINEAQGKERRRRLASLIFTLIWFEITIFSCKQFLTPICENLHLARHSPTISLSKYVALSTILPWLPVKDSSCFCFPADHGTIVIQWWLLFTFFAGRLKGTITMIPAILLLLPRLISGAHWFSDLAVGSVSITMIAFAWATASPLYGYLYRFLYRITKVRTKKPIAVEA